MQVVARLLDKGKIKGDTTDFHPERQDFTIDPEDGTLPVRVPVGDLKALYFVRSLDGNRDYQDHRRFQGQAGVRAKVWLEFEDGECMAAYPVSPFLGKHGFYVLPTDPGSNVEKAWISRPSLKRVLEGREAERAAVRFRPLANGRPSSGSWPREVRLG
ncbi:MAG TPA: hypothetical protein VKU85_16825 [bacterium]|nr:hypothetical protein [bacterium]